MIPALITQFQADLLLSALVSDEPRTAYGFTGGTQGGTRRTRIRQLVAAGLLTTVPGGRHTRYTITDKGRAFAQVLAELEEAV